MTTLQLETSAMIQELEEGGKSLWWQTSGVLEMYDREVCWYES